MKFSLVHITALVFAHQFLLSATITTTTASPIPDESTDPTVAAVAAAAAAAAALAQQGKGQGSAPPPPSGFNPDPPVTAPPPAPPSSGDASSGEDNKHKTKKSKKAKRSGLSGEDFMASHSLSMQALENTDDSGAALAPVVARRRELYQRRVMEGMESSVGVRSLGSGGELREEVVSSQSKELS